MKKLFTGALNDTRPDAEKAKDFRFDEIVASSDTPSWVEKNKDEWAQFPVRDQYKTSSCVAQSTALLLGILEQSRSGSFVDLSASFVYKRRVNKPQEGMIGVDAMEIVRKHGTTLEALMPSQYLTEKEIDSVAEQKYMERIAKEFSLDNYVQYAPRTSFEQIAGTIQKTGKGVMVWFRFNMKEWTDIPSIIIGASTTIHHSVVAIDAFKYKGEKYLLIQDSWGGKTAMNGRRLISEKFFEARNTFACYPIALKTEQEYGEKPTFLFTRSLSFSAFYFTDPDVVNLQKMLRYEGLFPANVDTTGYYGAITKKAVAQWLTKHGIEGDGSVFGPRSIAKANSLYP